MGNPVRLVVRGARHTPYLLRRAIAKAWHDRVLGLSAEAAFWQLLSLPSLFLALVATLGYVSRWFGRSTVSSTESTINRTLSRAFSHEVTDQVIAPTLHEVLHGQRADVISIGFLLALWAGSSATATFVNTITIAYDMRDLRGPVKSRLLALWVFLGTVVLGVFVLPLLVLGPDLLVRAFPERFHHQVSTLVDAAYYPLLVLLLLLGLATFYHLAPPRRLPWYRGVPGALLAILIFLAGSAALRSYIHFILDHNHAYTALAAPIAALLFFFVLALGVLLGAEFNAAIEQFRPTPVRPPRVLDPRLWRQVSDSDDEPVGPPEETTHRPDPGPGTPEERQTPEAQGTPAPVPNRAFRPGAAAVLRRAASAREALVDLLARRAHR
ncbi:MAG: YhjD/YihY/BrkB family envelope integrity protein [Jatrophihabitans sp.]|uniref:YihY/virulence factor BrkB family protein n=1 Tax=Jatrophihabitans sp. TaxID=1932789 RepID=UPI003F7FC983